MARPQKKRFICCPPNQARFFPDGIPSGDITLNLDEYETIRLIDLEAETQEECAKHMHVSRATVQSIYNDARRKLADAIVNGKRLTISGGDYHLCEFYEKKCGRGCGKHCHRELTRDDVTGPPAIIQGGTTMKIAVTYENGQIFQHFGHTQQFKLYEISDGKIVKEEIVDTNGSGHGALAGFLTAHQVETLICGGIGGGAQNALSEAGITLYGGCQGAADDAVAALLSGTLAYNPNVMCSHHGHGHDHGAEGHKCGSHGHEGHSCGHHTCS